MNQTDKLVEALNNICSLCDSQNQTHEAIWCVANDALVKYNDQQALESYNDGWVSVEERLPEMIEGKDYSENVIAWLDGERKIMCYSLVPDDDNNLCHAWCMVYDGLDGDGEFDDNYYPTHWQPLPTPPQADNKENVQPTGNVIKHIDITVDKDGKIEYLGKPVEHTQYAVRFSQEGYNKFFAIQSHPIYEITFKDQVISPEELFELLKKINHEKGH